MEANIIMNSQHENQLFPICFLPCQIDHYHQDGKTEWEKNLDDNGSWQVLGSSDIPKRHSSHTILGVRQEFVAVSGNRHWRVL